MSEIPLPTEPTEIAPAPTQWGALGMGLLLLVSAVGLLAGAPLLAVLALVTPAGINAGDTLGLLMLAAGSLALGLMLTPGVYLNARKFFNLPDLEFHLPAIPFPVVISLLALSWIVTLALGSAINTNPLPAKFLLPFLNVAAIFLPVGILLLISLRNLPPPSLRRGWSILGGSAALAPLLVMIAEMFAFAGCLVFIAFYASSTPGLDVIFQNLLSELQNGAINLDFLANKASSLFLAPGVTLALLGLFSLAVPIIEEALKVILLWFYAGRLHRPSEGFVLGILCGAAFALAENIGFASSGAEAWLANVLSRATAALPHMFNCGLLGWALVSAWQERRYLRLGLAYFAVILVHGSWNALSVLMALASLGESSAEPPAIIATPLPAMATWGLLVAGLFLGLVFANAWMRKQLARETAENVGYNPNLSS